MENKIKMSVWAVPGFKARFASLQKKAAELGCGGALGYSIGEEYAQIENEVEIGRYVEVCVWGEGPKHEGWTIRGRYDFKAIEGQCVFLGAPGFEPPKDLASVEHTRCDACCVSRRRNDVFLVEHEEQGFRVVGRRCLRNYLGHISPEQVAEWAAVALELTTESEERLTNGSKPEYFEFHTVLALAASVIAVNGWVKSGNEGATKSTVGAILVPYTLEGERERDEIVRKALADYGQQATDCIEWIKSIVDVTGYEAKLQQLTTGPMAWKMLGIAVSAIPAWKRCLGLKVTYPSDLLPESKHVGTVKARLTMEVTYLRRRDFDGEWGTTFIHTFRDLEGNDLIWFTGNSLYDEDLTSGDRMTIKATVKEHSEFNGRPQTKITRVAVQDPA